MKWIPVFRLIRRQSIRGKREGGMKFVHYRGEEDANGFRVYDGFGLLVARGSKFTDKLNGKVECYYDGLLIMEANYLDNKKEGEYKQYDQGVLVRSGNYHEGKKVGIWSELDIKTNKMSEVEYENDNPKYSVDRNGFAFEMKRSESGRVTREGSFCIQSTASHIYFQPESFYAIHGSDRSCLYYIDPSEHWEDHINNDDLIRELDSKNWLHRMKQGDDMTVYCVLPNTERQPLYRGHCDPHLSSLFCRHGRGTEFFPNGVTLVGVFENDSILRFGNFLDENGACFRVGEWHDGELLSIKNVDNYTVSNSCLFSEWNSVYDAFDADNFNAISATSFTEVNLANTQAVDVTGSVDFGSFLFVRSIVVGEGCFVNAKKVMIMHLPCLKEVVIGNGAFSQSNILNRSESVAFCIIPDMAREGELVVAYNPVLQSVKFGDSSFANTTQIIITGMLRSFVPCAENPRLKKLSFGEVHLQPSAFMNCGTFFSTRKFCLDRLPLLEELIFGDYAFFSCKSVSLQSASIGSFTTRPAPISDSSLRRPQLPLRRVSGLFQCGFPSSLHQTCHR